MTSARSVDLLAGSTSTGRSDPRPLRIAMVAPPWFSVPPKGYGGIESMVADLVDGLVAKGHHVTLIGVNGLTNMMSSAVSSRIDAAPASRTERTSCNGNSASSAWYPMSPI